MLLGAVLGEETGMRPAFQEVDPTFGGHAHGSCFKFEQDVDEG